MLCIGSALVVASFAGVSSRQSAPLRSYEGIAESGGALTKAKLRVGPAHVFATQAARVIPTSVWIYKDTVDSAGLGLVANALDRALCAGLSNRFEVVAANKPADLVVHATVTDIVATDATAAEGSSVAKLGVAALARIPAPRPPKAASARLIN
jgi:hypothetical protein